MVKLCLIYKSKDDIMNKKQSIGFCSILLASVFVQADIGGTVYKDIPLNGSTPNEYGKKESNEKGLSGITITAYDSNNNLVATTNSDDNGTWSLNTNDKVRVEFTNIPSYLQESKGQSSVQFVDDNTQNINLALYNPSEYATESNNDIAMTLQPNATAVNGASLKIMNKDSIPEGESNNDVVTTDTPIEETGSVWGLAYNNTDNTFYTTAVVRRHVAVGAKGTGAIYQRKDGETTLFTTIENTGTLPINRNIDLGHDIVFNEVGRVGLGDIDISSDHKKLYTINLNTNTFIEIDIDNPDNKNYYAIGNPFGSDTNCSEVRSWAIGQHNGKIYVGSVCTNDKTKGAYISEFNGSSFSPFHNIPLDMKGENSLDVNQLNNSNVQVWPDNQRWEAWISDYSTTLFNKDNDITRSSLPTPILSDIVFDENENMILGFIDRTALQTGTNNLSPDSNDTKFYKYDSAGDIYKVCKTTLGYVNEGQEGCLQHDLNAIAPAYPEFFVDEEWNGDVADSARHKEIALGGLAYVQGSKTLVSSAFDPTSLDATTYNTSGLIWMDTVEGTKIAGQKIVGGQTDLTYNGKSGGIGDIEILTPAAPTEIGNRVWFDENANCIQDANESGIAGVTLNLYESSDCTGSVVETNTTGEDGLYLFNVNAGTTYSVCIDGMEDQNPLEDKKLTCNDKGTTLNNSDAINSDDTAQITVTPLINGANDHSLDFGFTEKEALVVTPVEPITPIEPIQPVEPISTIDNNRTVDAVDDERCDCDSYTEDSTPALSLWSMLILISLTSLMAFLFRKELDEAIK